MGSWFGIGILFKGQVIPSWMLGLFKITPPSSLTAGGPQNDGPWKRWQMNMAIFGIYVKFLGVVGGSE